MVISHIGGCSTACPRASSLHASLPLSTEHGCSGGALPSPSLPGGDIGALHCPVPSSPPAADAVLWAVPRKSSKEVSGLRWRQLTGRKEAGLCRAHRWAPLCPKLGNVGLGKLRWAAAVTPVLEHRLDG